MSVRAPKPKSNAKRAGFRPTRRDNALSELLATPVGRTMLLVGQRAQISPADSVSPPGSALDTIATQLHDKTDLPPILGITAAMALIAATMAESGSTFTWEGDSHVGHMDLWLVALAPSGAGKTWIREVVAEALGLEPHLLPEPGSAPALLGDLRGLDGCAMWARDEYGQLMRAIADGGPRSELRDVMLRAYDHAELVHSTRTRGEIRVKSPVLTIYGTSVDQTWRDCVDVQMLRDGLLARHLFVVAGSRPLSVPRYPRQQIVQAIHESAADLASRIKTPEKYVISAAAAAVYDRSWRELVGQLGDTLDAAYVRRIAWAAARYAVIYHAIRGCQGVIVGPSEMRWAWRMVLLHCWCTREVLSMADSTLCGRVERVVGWILEQREKAENIDDPGFARAVIRRWHRDLKNIREAREMIDLARVSVRPRARPE